MRQHVRPNMKRREVPFEKKEFSGRGNDFNTPETGQKHVQAIYKDGDPTTCCLLLNL